MSSKFDDYAAREQAKAEGQLNEALMTQLRERDEILDAGAALSKDVEALGGGTPFCSPYI
jgi:hypothetical protein